MTLQIAWFITPHGFGHATRSAAVMSALRECIDVHFHIFSTVPESLMAQSLGTDFTLHPLVCDVGLVQHSALICDPAATVDRLGELLPFRDALLDDLALKLAHFGCRAVVADIAPLGLAVARRAGLPGILCQNFTWDWIYEAYLAQEAGLGEFIELIRDAYGLAELVVKTEPVCVPDGDGVTVPPVFRKVREPRASIRQRLGLAERPTVLVTMGGVAEPVAHLARMAELRDVCFLLTHAEPEVPENVICLPDFSEFYHPDLIQAMDGVVGKLGYSTVAEVYQAGVPFGYIGRDHFRESPVLARFMETHGGGMPIEEQAFRDGSWLSRVRELLAMPRRQTPAVNGADVAARHILRLVQN